MPIILLIDIDGESHPLKLTRKPLVLGRSKKCNVRFADELMSSKHCEISLNDSGRIVVKDLNSTNGTFINDVKIEAGYVFLGDILRVGNINISIDRHKLTKSEREALTDENIKTRHRFVDLENKKPVKTNVIADFTKVDFANPNYRKISEDDKTFVMDKKTQRKESERAQISNKLNVKRKEKIIKKDETGILKKIFKSITEK